MVKSIFIAAGLLCVSFSALAAPRPLIASESKIEFSVKEMGVAVPGEFTRFQANIDINPEKLEKSSADLHIEVGSLTTGSEEADAIAVDPNWLDKDHAPHAIFKSSTIKVLSVGHFEAKGTLSIRNKVRDLVIQFNSADQADGKTVITSNFIIKRSEFGIGGGIWNEGGVVAEEIPVKVKLTLGKPKAAEPAKAAAKPSSKTEAKVVTKAVAKTKPVH